MSRRALLLFHLAMGATYLGIFGAELAHRFAIRNVLILAGLGFWLTGLCYFLAQNMARAGIISHGLTRGRGPGRGTSRVTPASG